MVTQFYASEEEIADEAVDVTTTLVSDTDGMIYVTGLAGNKENKDFVPKGIQSKMYNRAVSNAAYLFESTYYLVETKAPDGYNLMDGYITVKVIYCPTIAGSVITQMLYLPGEVADINTPMFSIKGSPIPVQNLTGTLFPETGGIGTTIFTITGIVLMIGAAVVLIAKKRVSVKN